MEHELTAEIRTVAIIGLGLIGGSLARDLAGRRVHVLGWDSDEHTREQARSVVELLADDCSEIGRADVVVFAIPVRSAVKRLRELAPRLRNVRLITDVGSTKASIVRAAEELGLGDRFVGSHPMAGDHRSGWGAARTGLFAAARVFLTPAPSASGEAKRLAQALWSLTRPEPETMDAADHDQRLAWSSHLPQIVSTALALSLAQNETSRADLGAGGRDVTRLAGSDPAMWADILIDNRDALTPAIAMMMARLAGLQSAIESRDHNELQRLFGDARTWHRQE